MTHRTTLWLGSAITLHAICSSAYALSQQTTVEGTIPYNWPSDITTPVAVPLSAALPDPQNLTAHISLEGQAESQQIDAQYEPPDAIAGTPARAWLLWTARQKDRGKTVSFRFEPHETNTSSPFQFHNADPQIHLTDLKSQDILSYWYGQPEPDQRYPLTDYIHPIIGLDGETITDVRPDDHIHHRGIFWAWPRYECQGKEIGAWWLPTNMRCEPGPIDSSNGLIFARFSARHWLVHQVADSDTGQRLIQEDLVCRVFEPTTVGRAIDVEIILTALEKGVRIGGTTVLKKGYGGFTVRTAPADDIMIETNREFLANDAIRYRARWADWSGLFKERAHRSDAHRSGVAVLVHSSHPDAPTEWLLRHYGILNVAFPGLDMLEIPTDKPLRLRYRLWIHRGNAAQGRVDAQYRGYSADWKWKMN